MCNPIGPRCDPVGLNKDRASAVGSHLAQVSVPVPAGGGGRSSFATRLDPWFVSCWHTNRCSDPKESRHWVTLHVKNHRRQGDPCPIPGSAAGGDRTSSGSPARVPGGRDCNSRGSSPRRPRAELPSTAPPSLAAQANVTRSPDWPGTSALEVATRNVRTKPLGATL